VNALVFFLYSNASILLRRVSNTPQERDLPLAHVFFAGAFTGSVQALAISPLEYAKVHAQLHGTRPFRFLCCTVRAHGLAAVWRGTAVTVAREVTYGPYFFVYELIRRSSFASRGAIPTRPPRLSRVAPPVLPAGCSPIRSTSSRVVCNQPVLSQPPVQVQRSVVSLDSWRQ
jgi:hypothetical protein